MAASNRQNTWADVRKAGIYVSSPPVDCVTEYKTVFTDGAVSFIADLVRHFYAEVDELHTRRQRMKIHLSGRLPSFPEETRHVREDSTWRVAELPHRIQARKLDCGDVSPADLDHLMRALNSGASGIQVDFDDGHSPTWRNQVKGHFHIHQIVHSKMQGVPAIAQAPILMLRPRAWNMTDRNVMVDGAEAPGPLIDFGLLMFHCANMMIESQSGPFFYLSKLEGYLEARLWNRVFVWSQDKLGIKQGTIKACVLIENILASFEMEEILYELRDHSLGLNCGIWDYCASIISKFGNRDDFMIPDRSKYVNMSKPFLQSYMHKVIEVSHRRGALATGGMNAKVATNLSDTDRQALVDTVCRSKMTELEAGVDGFLIYDTNLVPDIMNMINKYMLCDNQLAVIPGSGAAVKALDLLGIPLGGVTKEGLVSNIVVGILFIYHWLQGRGTFIYNGGVEDSATAEISRSQIWQWIRHRICLEGEETVVSRQLIETIISDEVIMKLNQQYTDSSLLTTSVQVLLELVSRREFPEFITTYLNEQHIWLSLQ